MKDTDKDSPNSTFDPEELLARVENDHELLQDLLVIFKEEFPGHLQALREAVESGRIPPTGSHLTNAGPTEPSPSPEQLLGQTPGMPPEYDGPSTS